MEFFVVFADWNTMATFRFRHNVCVYIPVESKVLRNSVADSELCNCPDSVSISQKR